MTLAASSLRLPATLESFEAAIDRQVPASESVVRRYRHACLAAADTAADEAFSAALERASLREGLRALPLLEYQGVSVDVMDSTSLMRTRTHKSVDGCVTTAHCLVEGHDRIVFESGGNTGSALTVYASHVGIETFLFLPSDNVPLLDARAFEGRLAHVIAVEDASQVKAAASAFAEREGIPRVPRVHWRHDASALIGCFVLEHVLAHGAPTHFVQGISAAFAPIGIYGALRPFRKRLGRAPVFLGVQQAANCPMVEAWRGAPDVGPRRVSTTDGLLARVMYDGAPRTYGTFGDLQAVLVESGGDLTTLDRADFDRWLTMTIDGRTAIEHLAHQGIEVGVRDGEVLEKAGLMGLAGALREIAAGRFPAGSRLLVNVTGGTAVPAGEVAPERLIRAGEGIA